jgi:hypothetical protein
VFARLFSHHRPLPLAGFLSSSPEADQREEERDVVKAVDAPEHADLALVPQRVPEHELDEEAPLEHRLLVAEHLERVLAVVLPEPAVPDAAERGAVQAVLQPNAFAEEGSETACIYSR